MRFYYYSFYLTIATVLLLSFLMFPTKEPLSVERISTPERFKTLGDDSLLRALKLKIVQSNLKRFSLTDLQIIRNGSFTPKSTGKALAELPSFCLIAATLTPAMGSLIRIELWLPLENWNGRLLGTGNGGGAGSIAYESLAGGIKQGYATVNTDMGTSRGGANAAVGNPEIWKDFGYRATHEMTVVAKKIVNLYYGKPQHHAYFVGCSTGGQQGLMEAQRFPNDYDGIIAGAPANNRTHLHTSFLWNFTVANHQGKGLFSTEELNYVSKKVVDAYARQSGGAPGDVFLTNPGLVKVNVDSLFKCDGSAICLDSKKIAALKKIYDGPMNPTTNERIYTAFPVGSEQIGGGLGLQQTAAGAESLFYPFKWVFGKDFDPYQFDFDKDLDKLDSVLAPLLNANNPDLSVFKKKGGKMIMYTGIADPLVPYQDAMYYYDRVVKAQHGLQQTQSFFRYFLIPGMAHCGGGPGLIGFSNPLLNDLVQWTENRKVPEQLMAKAINCCEGKGNPNFNRPVYPYPKFPHYVGGDVNLASSYIGLANKQTKSLPPAKRYLN